MVSHATGSSINLKKQRYGRSSVEDLSIDWDKFPEKLIFDIGDPRSLTKTQRKRGIWSTEIEQPSPWAPELNRKFVVKPAKYWMALDGYRRLKMDTTWFERGQDVLVKAPEPQTMGWRAKDHSLDLDYAAKIVEIRGGLINSKPRAFVRVLWYYRPEDLPTGRQPYHAHNELIASNEIDIIGADTINDKITVRHLKEEDQEPLLAGDELFWRQTYNEGTVSKLREYCVCDSPRNPDPGRRLIRCDNCCEWLHGSCITKDAVRRAYYRHGLDFNEVDNQECPYDEDNPDQAFTASIHDDGAESVILVTDKRADHLNDTNLEEEIKCLFCHAIIK